jgi:hypothetical protein
MRNEQLLSETAVNSPARLRSRWAQLLQTAAAILTRAIRPAGINQNITGPLQVAGDLVAKNPWQRAANGAVDHVQVRVAHPSRKNPQNPLGALGLKILPLLRHQWLTRGMQHRRAHEGSNYPAPLPDGQSLETATGERHPAGRLQQPATAHAVGHAVHPTPLAADQPGRSEDLPDTARTRVR